VVATSELSLSFGIDNSNGIQTLDYLVDILNIGVYFVRLGDT